MVFIILYFVSSLTPSLEPTEIGLIKKCLNFYSVSEEELSFEKKWATDSTFLLKRVANSLDRPLWLPFYLDSTILRLAELEEGFSKAFEREGFALLQEILLMVNRTAKSFAGELEPQFGIMRFPQKVTWQKVIALLSPEEFDYLLYFSPDLFSDEEDTSDDYLKGFLHKEFNRQMKFDSTKMPFDSFFTVVQKVKWEDILASSLADLNKFSDYLTRRLIPTASETKKKNLGQEISGVKGKVYFYEENEWGKVVIGSEEDNLYYDEFNIILDFGGKDIYYSRNGTIGGLSANFSIIIDLRGNDLYHSEKPFSFAGALFGTSLLIDLKGDDIYRATEYSLGSSLFGLGILIDFEGNDSYEGKTATCGFAFYGLGSLFDLKGNDTYRAYNFAQGFGSTFGYGCLADFSGEDIYYAGGKFYHSPLLEKDFRSFAQGFAMGFRPDAGGGIGLLYDKKGNDFYNGDVFCQGTSYWYALGMLYDGEGNDKYSATQYSQGAGIHLASGILVDREGDDNYYSRFGPSQGEGHDLSVGIIVDKKGNDFYYCSGGQGIGLTNSFGLFLDSEGDDSYLTREREFGQGGANLARGFGGFGIFLDLQGNDIYPKDSKAKENTYFFQGFYGAGCDIKGEKRKEKEKEEIEISPEGLTNKPIAEIFKGASVWEVGSARKRVPLYRKELIKRDTIAINYIFKEKIGTKNSLELRAIQELCESLPEKVKPYLFKYLRDDRRQARANVIYLLGVIKAKDAVDSLILALKDKRNRPRWIISALGDIAKIDSIVPKEDSTIRAKITPVILNHLNDKSEPTRISATVALGKIKEEKAIKSLIEKLSDKIFTVRQAAENSLFEMGEKAIEPLILELKTKTPSLSVIRVLGKIAGSLKDDKEILKKMIRKELIPFLTSPQYQVRLTAVEALANYQDEWTKNLLKERLEEETEPIVLDRLKSALSPERKRSD